MFNKLLLPFISLCLFLFLGLFVPKICNAGTTVNFSMTIIPAGEVTSDPQTFTAVLENKLTANEINNIKQARIDESTDKNQTLSDESTQTAQASPSIQKYSTGATTSRKLAEDRTLANPANRKNGENRKDIRAAPP